MDRAIATEMRPELQKLLGPFQGKYEVLIGTARFSSTEITFSVKLIEKNAQGEPVSEEALALQRYAERGWMGLPKDAYKKQFIHQRDAFEAIGLNTKAVSYPILGKRLRDGKVFKFALLALGCKPLFGSTPVPPAPPVEEFKERA
jgi:hypothetical protein